jgi:hypothetical protein
MTEHELEQEEERAKARERASEERARQRRIASDRAASQLALSAKEGDDHAVLDAGLLFGDFLVDGSRQYRAIGLEGWLVVLRRNRLAELADIVDTFRSVEVSFRPMPVPTLRVRWVNATGGRGGLDLITRNVSQVRVGRGRYRPAFDDAAALADPESYLAVVLPVSLAAPQPAPEEPAPMTIVESPPPVATIAPAIVPPLAAPPPVTAAPKLPRQRRPAAAPKAPPVPAPAPVAKPAGPPPGAIPLSALAPKPAAPPPPASVPEAPPASGPRAIAAPPVAPAAPAPLPTLGAPLKLPTNAIPTVYTIGHELIPARSDLVALAAGLRCVIVDIRGPKGTRRYGYSPAALAEVGAVDLRAAIDDPAEGLCWLRDRVREGHSLLLLGYHAAPADCHRHRVGQWLEEQGIAVWHVHEDELVTPCELQRSIDAGPEDVYDVEELAYHVARRSTERAA